jgi:hypothetical protein
MVEKRAKFVKNMQSGVSYFLKSLAEKFVRYVPTFLLVLFFKKEVRNAAKAHIALIRGLTLCTQNSANATHENQHL